jgi:hypothetical protein
MAPDRTFLHLVEKQNSGRGVRPRPTPVQNYGVHFIKPQLRPWPWDYNELVNMYYLPLHVFINGKVVLQLYIFKHYYLVS